MAQQNGHGAGDQVQGELLAAVARYRGLEGERMFNHFLRNMLQQSNRVLREHGLVVVEDQHVADLETQLHKARSEAAAAAAYANCFGTWLKKIRDTANNVAEANGMARRALEWTPEKGEQVIGADDAPDGAQQPATQ